MTDLEPGPVRPLPRWHWTWWLLSALLLAVVAVDIVDGEAPKLVSSTAFFLAGLIAAATRPPRRRPVDLTVVVLVVVGLVALLVRVWAVLGG